jgi:hypothetical protein
VEGFSDVGWGEKSKLEKENKFFTRKHAMKGDGIESKTLQKGKNLNNFKA